MIHLGQFFFFYSKSCDNVLFFLQWFGKGSYLVKISELGFDQFLLLFPRTLNSQSRSSQLQEHRFIMTWECLVGIEGASLAFTLCKGVYKGWAVGTRATDFYVVKTPALMGQVLPMLSILPE